MVSVIWLLAHTHDAIGGDPSRPSALLILLLAGGEWARRGATGILVNIRHNFVIM